MTDITDVATSNSLADLAHRIRQEHRAVAIALKDSVRHAIMLSASQWSGTA